MENNIKIRVINSAKKAAAQCEGGAAGDSNAWHSIRNAAIRAIRRECGYSRIGHAPEWVYQTACDFADEAYTFRGWDESFTEAWDQTFAKVI